MKHRYDISAPEAKDFASQAIPVGNVIVIDEQQRVLLGRRHPDSRYEPGKWNLPGGCCEDGESYEAAALRELHEEFGLALEASALRHLGGFCCVYDDRVVSAIYFLAYVESVAPICVAMDEFSDGGFYPLAEVAEWDLAFQQQGVIQDFRAAVVEATWPVSVGCAAPSDAGCM